MSPGVTRWIICLAQSNRDLGFPWASYNSSTITLRACISCAPTCSVNPLVFFTSALSSTKILACCAKRVSSPNHWAGVTPSGIPSSKRANSSRCSWLPARACIWRAATTEPPASVKGSRVACIVCLARLKVLGNVLGIPEPITPPNSSANNLWVTILSGLYSSLFSSLTPSRSPKAAAPAAPPVSVARNILGLFRYVLYISSRKPLTGVMFMRGVNFIAVSATNLSPASKGRAT